MRTNRKTPDGQDQALQINEALKSCRESWADLNYRNYNSYHPEIQGIFSDHPDDRREAEKIIWGKVFEATGDLGLADLLSRAIGKRHQKYEPVRTEFAVIQLEELRQARERRKINRESGGKVVFLEQRRKTVEAERRKAIVSGDRQALGASSVSMGAAIRQYWSDYTKLARTHISNDWKPPENRISDKELENRPLLDFVLSFDELTKLDLPERESIVAPFLPSQSISLVFAARGLGKSWFCMELALAVADGRKFLSWNVPAARRVLYIDGEMSTKMLVDRFKALSRKIPSNLDVLPSEILWTDDIPLNLNIEADQRRISIMLETLSDSGRKPELIIFDNLSSLTAGGDENSNSELDSLLRFMVGLRHKGYAILLVHHAGKGGDQRGASRREDLLDTSIKLNAVKDSETLKGAKFGVEFVKVRGERPNPDKIDVELIAGEHGNLEWTIGKKEILTLHVKMLIAIRDIKPQKQSDLMDYLEVSQGLISQQMAAGRNSGNITGDRIPTLTKSGLAFVDKISPVDLEPPF